MSASPLAGRVVAAFGHQLLVALDDGRSCGATRRGRRTDVVVGDRVGCAPAGTDSVVIERVEPRGTLLFRSDAWREKSLAANVDQMVLVFAPEPAYHLQFLWRALVAARAAGIPALALMNKRELATPTALGDLAALAALEVATLTVSARTEPQATCEALAARLGGRANLLVGQSGMGKSTLLNLLVPDAQARTQEWSRRLNVGKQTTTASRWFEFDVAGAHGSVVDSPGFTAFGLRHLSGADVLAAMPDFAPALGHCRFSNCRHDAEPDCAVRAAVTAGRIDPRRHAFFLEVMRERGA